MNGTSQLHYEQTLTKVEMNGTTPQLHYEQTLTKVEMNGTTSQHSTASALQLQFLVPIAHSTLQSIT